MAEPITFRAALAARSGWRRHEDGATLVFDVPDSDVAAAVPLLALPRCVLQVTITIADAADAPLINNQDQAEHRARRRSQRVPTHAVSARN